MTVNSPYAITYGGLGAFVEVAGGMAHLVAMLVNSAGTSIPDNTVIATIPSGYRPKIVSPFKIIKWNDQSNVGHGYVFPNGNVSIAGVATEATSANVVLEAVYVVEE